MNQPADQIELVGKTIARILQTEWKHWEKYSYCQFFIEFTDGMLIRLEEDSIDVIDGEARAALTLQDIDTDSDFPAYWTAEGYTGVGATIERVLAMTYGQIYLQLSGRYFLTSEVAEGQTALSLSDYDELLHSARIFAFFDYWTQEPVIFENMRAIDLVLTSGFDDLALGQSGELHLTIGRVKDGNAHDLLSERAEACVDGWIARIVVPEPGIYRIIVQRRFGESSVDVKIDESIIAAGRLVVRVA